MTASLTNSAKHQTPSNPTNGEEVDLRMNFQEGYYLSRVDYRKGSPHLSNLELHDRLIEVLRGMIQRLADQGLPLRVLEVGAGHGGFTESALAMGCEVTAVEMSGASVDELRRRFGTNSKFRAIHNPNGALRDIDIDSEYSLVMSVSVLHHIPDYMSFLEEACQRITDGGALLALQDPLWYSRHRTAHRVDRAAYFVWRLGQGNLYKGIQTRLRRFRGILDETEPGDVVEYHVIRSGVDEEKILSFAKSVFSEVSLIQYWSNQLGLAQRIGDQLGLCSHFGIIANGYKINSPRLFRYREECGGQLRELLVKKTGVLLILDGDDLPHLC
jgi:SAM-dependent methyltransferase